jgi:hypothetical protein
LSKGISRAAVGMASIGMALSIFVAATTTVMSHNIALFPVRADGSVDTGTGLCKGSRRRFLHEFNKNGSGAQGNHCHRETRNHENAHNLSPAATANSTHLR